MPKFSQVRDSEGLLFQQRRWLDSLLRTQDWAQSTAEAGVSSRTVRRWLHEDESFKTAYQNVIAASTDDIHNMLDAANEEAVHVLTKALKAEAGFKVKYDCPHPESCASRSKKHVLDLSATDWKTRLAAVQMMLKAKGVLIDRKKVEHGGTIEVLHLTASEHLAIARWRHGYSVPDHMRQKFEVLQTQGLLEGPKRETEVRVMTIEEESDESTG